jgi:hypothetical protein
MKPFKFFQKFEPYQLEIQFPQPRYPRAPIRAIPYPENYVAEFKTIFRRGWRACERGLNVYDNPYSTTEQLIYVRHEA